MIENATDTRTHNAIKAAHDLRGQMVANAWAWLFGRPSR